MRHARSLVRALVVCAVLVSGATRVHAQVTFRVRPDLGARYEIATSIHTLTQASVMGTDTNTEQRMRLLQEMVFAAGENPDEFTAVTTITAASMDMSGGAQATTGHEDGEADPLEGILDGLVGHSFQMTLTTAGKVTSISGMDEVMTAMLESIDAPPELMATLAETVKQQFGDDAMKKMMGQAFLAFPVGPVEIGDSWPMETAAMGIRNVTTLTLQSVEDGIATLVVDGSMEPDAEYDPTEGGFGVAFEAVDGSGTGTYRIDVATGMLVDADIVQNMTATIRIVIPGMTEEMAARIPPMPMTSESTIHVESRKLD